MTIPEIKKELERARKEIEGLSQWRESYPRLAAKIKKLERELKAAQKNEGQGELF